jgi:transcriptional regulator with XRE-family HTH domain
MRAAREKSGLGVRQLAAKLHIGHSTVSQWENTKRVPTVEDVASYLGALHATQPERRRILDLARRATDPEWLTGGARGHAQAMDGLTECERTASDMYVWNPMLVPGLFQIPDYTAVIMGSSGLSAEEAENRATIRLLRQQALTRRNPLQVHALIGMPVLRQRIGGPTVMSAQLRHLLAVSRLPMVKLQLADVEDDWHPGLTGPFTFYEFPDMPSIVIIEHYRSSAFLYNAHDVSDYRDAVDSIATVAISPQESVELIAHRLVELE